MNYECGANPEVASSFTYCLRFSEKMAISYELTAEESLTML